MFEQITKGIKNPERISATGQTSAEYLNALAMLYYAAQDHTKSVDDNDLNLIEAIETIVISLAKARREADVAKQLGGVAI